MKKLSLSLLSSTIITSRKNKKMTQKQLAELTGINRGMLSRLEQQDYTPSIEQLEKLGEVLDFEPTDMFLSSETDKTSPTVPGTCRLAVAGTGYVGLSLAVLLSQHNPVTAVDIVPEKVEQINRHISPIRDEYIEKYLSEKKLSLTAVTDGAAAYKDADFVIIAAPTNYDSKKNFFDTSAVEAVIELVMSVNDHCIMIIKSTVPVGYTISVRKKYHTDRILFSPEFLRESKALYDNLYPSRIIVGCDEKNTSCC